MSALTIVFMLVFLQGLFAGFYVGWICSGQFKAWYDARRRRRVDKILGS